MNIFKILLITHVLCGTVSLIAGTINVLLKKGNKTHLIIGKVFYYSLLIGALVSLPMAYLHPNYFLFIVGVFTIYMLMSGKRFLRIKSIFDVKLQDKILAFIMLFFGLGFIGFGGFKIYDENLFGIVFLAFGFVSLRFVYIDFKLFKAQSKFKNYGLVTHIQRMTGAYIASVTAFLVQNIKFMPSFVIWLLPSFLIVPFIFIWVKKYKKLV